MIILEGVDPRWVIDVSYVIGHVFGSAKIHAAIPNSNVKADHLVEVPLIVVLDDRSDLASVGDPEYFGCRVHEMRMRLEPFGGGDLQAADAIRPQYRIIDGNVLGDTIPNRAGPEFFHL